MKKNNLYEWVQVSDRAAFPPRDGAGALIYQDRMWLIGGWNPADKTTNPIHSDCNNEVWNSSDGISWNLVKPNTHVDHRFDPISDWEARHTAGYAVHRDRMWIIGGDPLLGHYQNDVWNSSDGRQWNLINRDNPVPWAPRVLHHTAVFNNKLWIMGGQTLPQFAPAPEIYYNDVWFSEDGLRWTQAIVNAPWAPRGLIGGSAVFQDRIWLIGGGIYATASRPYSGYTEVWSSPDGFHWDCHTRQAPWSPRVYHDVAVFDNRLWLLEGYHTPGDNANDVWFSADGKEWEQLPDSPWQARHAASVFVFNDALWIMAGCHMGRDIWKLIHKEDCDDIDIPEPANI